MLRHGGVFVIAAHALMRGDPLALVEDLDGTGREPHLDLGAGEAMRNAVVMLLHLDVVIETDAADPPLGEDVGGRRQWLERRPVDLLEQPAACHAEPPDRPFLIQPREQFADRRIDLGQAVEGAMAQAAEQPALDDEDGLLDLGLGKSRRRLSGGCYAGLGCMRALEATRFLSLQSSRRTYPIEDRLNPK